MPTTALDLGCGAKPRNAFKADVVYGVDVRDDLDNHIVKADLAIENVPFGDNFFDYVTAYDFIEHIPRLLYVPQRRYPFVELMNEIWRVLKPGGQFLSFTPAFPSGAAFCDPTHVNFITQKTFPLFFDNVNRWGKIYGFKGAFKVRRQSWKATHLTSVLVKVLPPPEKNTTASE